VEVAQALKKMIISKEKVATLSYQKTFAEFKESSQLVSDLFTVAEDRLSISF
jgi:hypothetical protein